MSKKYKKNKEAIKSFEMLVGEEGADKKEGELLIKTSPDLKEEFVSKKEIEKETPIERYEAPAVIPPEKKESPTQSAFNQERKGSKKYF